VKPYAALSFMFAIIATALTGSSALADPNWEVLGTRQVNFVGDHDTIIVTALEGRFDAIKLDVDRGDLELYDVVVTFGNGEKFSPATRYIFNEGTRSRNIDLPGAKRVIKKVDFYYRSKLRNGRATLTLWGRHGHAAAPVVPVRPAPIQARWEQLGQRQVKFRAEKDTIPVTVKEGSFDAIKIEVTDGDVEMYDIVVTFANGEKFSPATRYTFDQGTRSRVIDLPGDARFIRKVDFYYRSKLRKGRANVVLHGRHAN
jgi:hypothetical protein